MNEKAKGHRQKLLAFLSNPASYPHEPEKVDHIQTHISHVFIVPPFVYKIKKPVDFGFLDYSDLEKRRKYCHREVELNRRLCSGIYLGVIGIGYDGQQYALVEKDDPSTVEYAVKMKKLPEQYFLYRYIEDDSLTKEHLDRVAEKLADFYREQQAEADLAEWGTIDTIKVNTDENFDQTGPFIGRTISRPAYDAIRYFTNQYFVTNEALFKRRIAEGRIVDGHGDLHLDHIHIMPEEVRIYDCIEFNDRFRYGDLAADLAFLAMDLDFNGCRREERYFIEQMADRLDDPDLLKIIDFYKCYRAYVKGKVKSLQSDEDEIPGEERKQAAESASRYFDLSLRYALLGSQPRALIFMGRVGTGKSTLAGHLSDKLSTDHFASDRIRKKMAGLNITERAPEEQREELYSRSMSRKTYNALLEKMCEYIDKGESVILDATFSSSELREEFMEALEERRVDYFFIEAKASDETIAERLKQREKRNGVISDARLEDFEKLSSGYEVPREIGSDQLFSVSTEQPRENTIEQIFMALVKHHLETD